MRCAFKRCNSNDVGIVRTKTSDQKTEMVSRYIGMNITFRRYKCNHCGSRFATVEVPEQLFQELTIGDKLSDNPVVPIDVRKSPL